MYIDFNNLNYSNSLIKESLKKFIFEFIKARNCDPLNGLSNDTWNCILHINKKYPDQTDEFKEEKVKETIKEVTLARKINQEIDKQL